MKIILYFSYLFSEIIEVSKSILKLCALIHILDGTLTTASGVLRSLGEQGIVSVFFFISFDLVGLPLGIVLLFKTQLELYGEYIKSKLIIGVN